MKFTLDAKQLYQASFIAKGLASKNRELPTLGFMQVKSQNGKITVRSTDLEKMVWMTISGESDGDGELCVPIKLVETFTKKEKGKVTLEEVQHGTKRAIITGSEQGGSATLSMDAYAPKDMVPDTIFPDGSHLITVGMGPDFARTLTMALTCAACEDSRPVLTGILLDGQHESLAVASADGFRLFHRKLGVPIPKMQAVIPGHTGMLIARIMGKKAITMSYCQKSETASFSTDDCLIYTQLVRGNFPQYLQLIPKEEPSWTFECSSPLLEQRLNQYIPDSGGIVRMSRNGDDDPALKLEMGVGDSEAFSAHYVSVVPATLQGDTEGRVAANQLYLTAAVRFFSSVLFKMTNPSSPMVITGDVDGVLVVLMPMFVQW